MKFLFFNSRYLNNYFVYNLSGIDYDRSKFNNNIALSQWADHEAPPLFDILSVCENALDFFAMKRFGAIGKGVNQPSQLRYITLFSYMMSNQLVLIRL